MNFIKKIFLFFFLFYFLASCKNKIETAQTISHSEILFLQSRHLLDSNETIIKFYSTFKNENSGNYFTNKRIAVYWIDPDNKAKNKVSFAFYQDIKNIDTIYQSGLTHSPFLLITKKDGTKFKVFVEGTKNDLENFYTTAINEWRKNSN